MDASPSYQRVLYKAQEDPDKAQFVDSLNYAPPKFDRYKVFTSDIFQEELSKRKRAREDEYIKKLQPNEKPVLIISENHLYKDKQGKLVADKSLDKYYKVSKNTKAIEDMKESEETLKQDYRRTTRLHGDIPSRSPQVGSKVETETSPAHQSPHQKLPKNVIQKVNGVELLPAGFIELDPLLLKDQYQFESEYQEKLFLEEQRRMVQLRQKQYQQRNELKKRDVAIYVLSDAEKAATSKIRKTIVKTGRRLNDQEATDLADEFNTGYEKIKYLEEVFIDKNGITDMGQFAEEERRKEVSGLNGYKEFELNDFIDQNLRRKREKRSRSRSKAEKTTTDQQASASQSANSDRGQSTHKKSEIAENDQNTAEKNLGNTNDALTAESPQATAKLESNTTDIKSTKVVYRNAKREEEKRLQKEGKQPKVTSTRTSEPQKPQKALKKSKSPVRSARIPKDVPSTAKPVKAAPPAVEKKVNIFGVTEHSVNNDSFMQDPTNPQQTVRPFFKVVNKRTPIENALYNSKFDDFVVCSQIDGENSPNDDFTAQIRDFRNLNETIERQAQGKTEMREFKMIKNKLPDDQLTFYKAHSIEDKSLAEPSFLCADRQKTKDLRYYATTVAIQNQFYVLEIAENVEGEAAVSLTDSNLTVLDCRKIKGPQVQPDFYHSTELGRKSNVIFTVKNEARETIFSHDFKIKKNTEKQTRLKVESPEKEVVAFCKSDIGEAVTEVAYACRPIFVGGNLFRQVVYYKAIPKKKPVIKIRTFNRQGRMVAEQYGDPSAVGNCYFSVLDRPVKVKGNKLFAMVNTVNNFGTVVDQLSIVVEEDALDRRVDEVLERARGWKEEEQPVEPEAEEVEDFSGRFDKKTILEEESAIDSNRKIDTEQTAAVAEDKRTTLEPERVIDGSRKIETVKTEQVAEDREGVIGDGQVAEDKEGVIGDEELEDNKQTIAAPSDEPDVDLESEGAIEPVFDQKEEEIVERTAKEVLNLEPKLSTNESINDQLNDAIILDETTRKSVKLEQIGQENQRGSVNNLTQSETTQIETLATQVLQDLTQITDSQVQPENLENTEKTQKKMLSEPKIEEKLIESIMESKQETLHSEHKETTPQASQHEAVMESVQKTSEKSIADPNQQPISTPPLSEKMLEAIEGTNDQNLAPEEFQNKMSEVEQAARETISQKRQTNLTDIAKDENDLRQKLSSMFKDNGQLMNALRGSDRNQDTLEQAHNLFEEFYEFCKQIVNSTPQYDESVFFVSLFYYFLEKKDYVHEPPKVNSSGSN